MISVSRRRILANNTCSSYTSTLRRLRSVSSSHSSVRIRRTRSRLSRPCNGSYEAWGVRVAPRVDRLGADVCARCARRDVAEVAVLAAACPPAAVGRCCSVVGQNVYSRARESASIAQHLGNWLTSPRASGSISSIASVVADSSDSTVPVLHASMNAASPSMARACSSRDGTVIQGAPPP